MRDQAGRSDFGETGKVFLEQVFRSCGNVRSPLLVYAENGIIKPHLIPVPEEIENPEKFHGVMLNTIAETIRRVDPPELFLGYQGFYLMSEGTAVKVLVGTLYSDDGEETWLNQIHGDTLGEWQEASHMRERFGFDGLWHRAKAHAWN